MAKNKIVEFKNVLSQDQKEALFQSAVKDKHIYSLIDQSNITSDHFQELDLYLWYVWEVLQGFYKRQRRLPSLKEFRLELNQRMDDPKDYLDDVTADDLTAFYKTLKSAEPIGKDTAREYLQQIFAEKIWRDVRLHSEQPKVPVSITEALDAMKSDVAASAALSADPIPSPFDIEEYNPVTRRNCFIPYGVPFIDAYLGGGGVAGEVYVILGATGSGKTSLLQQLSVSLAALQMAKWEHGNKRQSFGIDFRSLGTGMPQNSLGVLQPKLLPYFCPPGMPQLVGCPNGNTCFFACYGNGIEVVSVGILLPVFSYENKSV